MMEIACWKCDVVTDVPVLNSEFEAWQNGELIQNAMPDLNNDDREMLISKICPKCWDEMFAGFDGDDE